MDPKEEEGIPRPGSREGEVVWGSGTLGGGGKGVLVYSAPACVGRASQLRPQTRRVTPEGRRVVGCPRHVRPPCTGEGQREGPAATGLTPGPGIVRREAKRAGHRRF